MKTLMLFTLSLTLAGCAATMVNSPGGKRSKFGPMNDSERIGSVKYLNQGASFVIDSRREDAYKQMYLACHGKYVIVSEGPKAGDGVINRFGSSLITSSEEYWYINFKCAKNEQHTADTDAKALEDDL